MCRESLRELCDHDHEDEVEEELEERNAAVGRAILEPAGGLQNRRATLTLSVLSPMAGMVAGAGPLGPGQLPT